LAAVADHALLESVAGGYVAEDRAQASLEQMRRDVAGLLGTDADGVAFLGSATAALEALVDAWPLRAGARVGVAAAEWGPNLEILMQRGLVVEELAVDDDGVLDLAALAVRLRDAPPDVLLVDQVAAHRGLLQPAAAVVAVGRQLGVPVWVDAAQALGHVPVASGDATLGTSRKWLAGPRGVGMLAVAEEHRAALRVRRAAKHADLPTVQHLEASEAHVAGRVGLGVAVREYLELGPDRVTARLDEVGRLVREAVQALDGWEVARPEAPSGAITGLRATAGQDVVRTRERLLHEHGILTTVCLPWRAPLEMSPARGVAAEPLLRVSPHVDLTADDLEQLCRALATD
jgi:pyridoxal 5-phosphate dependent beta-lyase